MEISVFEINDHAVTPHTSDNTPEPQDDTEFSEGDLFDRLREQRWTMTAESDDSACLRAPNCLIYLAWTPEGDSYTGGHQQITWTISMFDPADTCVNHSNVEGQAPPSIIASFLSQLTNPRNRNHQPADGAMQDDAVPDGN